MAYLLGIIIGLLVKNYHTLFILMAIPTGYVLFRGAKNEDKWNKQMNKIIEEYEEQQKSEKNSGNQENGE